MNLSLIINTYNKAHLLRKSLTSLSVQSCFPEELILADDGSKEDLISVAKEFKSVFHFPMKFVSQKDDGFRLARCRNNGVREASGDFIIFLDQDIIYSKNFILTMKKSIQKGYCSVGFPIRTSKEQLDHISPQMITTCNYQNILTKNQIHKIHIQYRKDCFYNVLSMLRLRKKGAKFRGGVAGMFKADFKKINGYDENYIGWGNEDDDFARRLFAAGVRVKNPFKTEYPIHLWHPEHHINGERVNLNYHKNKKIDQSNFKCVYGYDNTLGDDQYFITEI